MPHDEVRIEETRAWFHKASEDLRAADLELTAVWHPGVRHHDLQL